MSEHSDEIIETGIVPGPLGDWPDDDDEVTGVAAEPDTGDFDDDDLAPIIEGGAE